MLGKLAAKNAMLDGEVVVTDAAGRTNFSDLKTALSTGKTDRFQYYVFDILRLDGDDLRPLPLIKRKAALKALLATQKGKPAKHILFSENFDDDPAVFCKHVCSLEMEGVVCKQANAPYVSGRSKSWLKVKCSLRQEFVIGGFTLSTTSRSAIGALLLGYYDAGRLFYAGRVGTGWSHAVGEALWQQLTEIKVAKSPFVSVWTRSGGRAPSGPLRSSSARSASPNGHGRVLPQAIEDLHEPGRPVAGQEIGVARPEGVNAAEYVNLEPLRMISL